MAEGIHALSNEVKKLEASVGALSAHVERFTAHVDRLFCHIERRLDQMPTREEINAAKAELMTSITDAANRVSTDLQALRDQIAAGNPVTDQDLADLQADIQAVGQIDPANPQPPAGRR